MRVVVDSNVICEDYQMAGSAFRVLLDWVTKTANSLHVPQLVIDEVVNKYEEELKRCQAHIAKQLNRVRAVTGARTPDPLDEGIVKANVQQYRQALQGKLGSFSAVVGPYPSVSHEDVVRRALSRKKPFSESGRGYRDALIWETVIDIASADPESVAFVTANRKDFCEGERLHPDLLSDLEERGLDSESILIFLSLDSFVSRCVKPELEVLDVREQLLAGQYKQIDLREALSLQLLGWLETMELEPSEIGFPGEFEDPTVSSVQGLTIEEVTDVHVLPSGELLVSLLVDAEFEFDFFIFKSNYYIMDEERAPYVSDHDWNKHYVAASQSSTITLALSLTLDEASGEITSLDVDENLTSSYGEM